MHLDNLLFLLLVTVAVLFQLLAKTAGKASKDQTTRSSTSETPPPIPRASRESDEEKIRKLLEALGQPPTSKPPRTVTPRTDVPPRPLAPVQPPTLHPPVPWQLTRQQRRQRGSIPKETPVPRVVTGAEVSGPQTIATASSFEVHEGLSAFESSLSIKGPRAASAAAMQKVATKPDSRTEIATLLASKSSLRDAMILREILGPPRGLRAMNSP
jgi:hypothetical protein